MSRSQTFFLSSMIASIVLFSCGDDDESHSANQAVRCSTGDVTGYWSGMANIDGMTGQDMEVVMSIIPDGSVYFCALNYRGHFDCQAADVLLEDMHLSFTIFDGDMDSARVSLDIVEDSLSGRWRYTTTPQQLAGDISFIRLSEEYLSEDELFALDAFVPLDFQIPTVLETDRFRLRMLSVSDVEIDYEAVMSSSEHLRNMSGGSWPAEDMTLEDDLRDLERHQNEFLEREAFAYTVVNLPEDSVLGCVYINPPWGSDPEFDAVVAMWVRSSELESGLDTLLFGAVECWFEESWPFQNVFYY